MRKLTFGFVVASMSMIGAAHAQSVESELRWCAGDWGHNEGASEATSILSNYTAVIDPATTAMVRAGLPVLGTIIDIFNPNADPAGEILKRPPVLRAATTIVHISEQDAVDLALTCQAHNGGAVNFLNSRRGEVADWLRSNTISF